MNFISRKIEALQQQPDHQKVRSASIIIVIAAIVILVIWAALLLPLQLAWNRPAAEDDILRGQVGGAQDFVEPLEVQP